MEELSAGAAQPSPGGPVVLRGEVLGPDGTPVAGARVVITSAPVPVADLAAVTDASGRFTLNAPAPGEYAFAAHPVGAGPPATARVTVPPAAAPAASPEPSADPDASLGSDQELESFVESPPAPPAAEIHVTLSFPADAGGAP